MPKLFSLGSSQLRKNDFNTDFKEVRKHAIIRTEMTFKLHRDELWKFSVDHFTVGRVELTKTIKKIRNKTA